MGSSAPAIAFVVGLTFSLQGLGRGALESYLVAFVFYWPLYWLFGAWRKVEDD